jgi:protein-disulfide isomerase
MKMEKIAVPIAIILAGGLIAGALYLSNTKAGVVAKAGTQQATAQATAGKIRSVSGSDHILGNPNAQVIIVEYSDTECPYCKQFQTTLHQVINDYGASGQVAWVYRDFPIVQLHPRSPKESEATECAGELGGPSVYWKYLDEIYAITPSNNGLDPAELPKIAKDVGLNVDSFNTCLSSGKYVQKVETDRAEAVAAGGQGTPFFVLINTKDGSQTPMTGAYPYEQLKPIIDAMLKS